jgi:HTH-type transcriptional regulator / antitoxin HipB
MQTSGGPASTDAVWTHVRTPADLGAFLRQLRKAKGWTQAELAEELGVTRQYVVELETGKPNLYNERLFQALRLLGGSLRAQQRS